MTKAKPSGARAGSSGVSGAATAARHLTNNGYRQLTAAERRAAVDNYANGLPWYDGFKDKVFALNLPVYESIYGTTCRPTLLAWDPARGMAVVVEVKKQTTSGSVDEKYPYALLTLAAVARQMEKEAANFIHAVFLLLAPGAKPAAVEWVRNNAEPNFLVMTSEKEFHAWANANL